MPYSYTSVDDKYVVVNDDTNERLDSFDSKEGAMDKVQSMNDAEGAAMLADKMLTMKAGDLVSYNSEEMYGFVVEVIDAGEHEGLLATEADPVIKIAPATYDEDAMDFVEKTFEDPTKAHCYHYASVVSPYKLDLPEDAPVFDWETGDMTGAGEEPMGGAPGEGLGEVDESIEPDAVADEVVGEESVDEEEGSEEEGSEGEDEEDSEDDESLQKDGLYDDLNLYELTQEQLVRIIEMMGHPEDEIRSMLEGRMKKDAMSDRFASFSNSVNMSASEISRWGQSECANLASRPENGGLGAENVRQRVIKLLQTPKSKWGKGEYRVAGRVINFISRMRGTEQGEPAKDGCPSKRDISLMNWGFNPNKKAFRTMYVKMKGVSEEESTEEGAVFNGYGSVFDVRDLGRDIVKKGAFKQTLIHKNGRVFLQADHKYGIVDFLGVAYVSEDDKGLAAKLVINTKTRLGRETADNIRFCLEHNLPIGLSIGYDSKQDYFDTQTKSRIITEVQLYELSVVIFPMNTDSLIESAKYMVERLDSEAKKAIIKHLQGAL